MSYILDALKESQAYRDIAEAGSDSPQTPAGQRGSRVRRRGRHYLMPSVVAICAVIVSFVVLQPRTTEDAAAISVARTDMISKPQTSAPKPQPSRETTPAPMLTAANSVVEKPITSAPVAAQFEEMQATLSAWSNNDLSVDLATTPAPSSVPLLVEMPASYRHSLGPLHIDVHVYDPSPSRRFVMLNQRKYREGQSTAGGVAVETITADGLVVAYEGRRFRLPL